MAYNPSIHTTTNKPIGISGKPTEARSYYYDSGSFSYRLYNSPEEVLSYLNTTTYRTGHFSIFILISGQVKEYWFRDGTADNNLVEKTTSGGGTGIGTFTNMPSTVWDGTEVRRTLAESEYWTLSTSKTAGIALVTGNGNSLEINGHTINLAPTGVTIVGFVRDGASYYFDSSYAPASSGGGATVLTAPVLSLDGADLEWFGVLGASSYTARKSSSSDMSSPTTYTSVSSPYTIPDSGTTYWQVKAVGDGSTYLDSPWSNIITYVEGGGILPTANRVGLYTNASMIRSGGAVTQWDDADGNSDSFTVVDGGSTYPAPIDATTDGLQITSNQNLFADPGGITLNAPFTIYALIKKTNTGALLTAFEGGSYAIYLDASVVLWRPNFAGYQQNNTGIANMADFKVVAFKWTGGTDPAKIFLDGALVGSFNSVDVGHNEFKIYGMAGTGSDAFRGYIKGLAFYSVAHSDADIATNSPLFKSAVD
jgi:hypothetical protein